MLPAAVLPAAGRHVRLVVTMLVATLLLAGTVIGADDDFPFGPFRMYATRDDPNGLVISTRVEAVDSSGRVQVVPDSATGLRRAEIEGQIGRFRRTPALLGLLSQAHARLHPAAAPYRQVRVVERRYRLHDGAPTGPVTERVVVQWPA